ncbi:hypothetical protein MNBD_NITROSPINAE05-251 [hydrothermal vent metagenome]|uniref:Uncharacterized protein n=1 Tax=hydrothermal vent metagenome TaxID=652676 RepID=A0A3B1D4C6_9ZZZZ
MIDEIDYFPKRDKYKKKGAALDSEWDALKKTKADQDSARAKSSNKTGEKEKTGKKKP